MSLHGLGRYASGLWVHDGTKRFHGGLLHRWMTVVKLGGDRLLIISPNTLTPTLRAELDALGWIAFVISTDPLHGHAIAAFADAYPDARIYGAPGVLERHPTLPIGRVLTDTPESEWSEEFDQAITAGDAHLPEAVFFHRASRTLIIADLIENIHREHIGTLWNLGARLIGQWQKPAPVPEHRLYLSDPDAFERSIVKVRSWDFERIVLAHGRFIERDARDVFDRVMDKMIADARRRPRALRLLFQAAARVS